MLTSGEFDEIAAVLTQILAMNGAGRAWFAGVYGGPTFLVVLDTLAGPAASDQQVAAAAIRACMLREWLDDPCWLLRLMRQVKANGGAGGIGMVANAEAIIARLEQRINVLDDVWYTPWVRDGLPFFDRGPLRDTLKTLARNTGRPILRIEGDPASGKSYSSQLLEYVSQETTWSFQVINVEVTEGSEIMMNALSLAQIIVGEMGFKNTVADSGLPDPTVHNIPLLQTWILQSARASGKQWWLFLDGFRKLPEKNTARDLIQGLGDKIANGNYRQHLRLILSDYDKALSRVEEEKVAFDRPQRLPDAEALPAVRDCLSRVYREANRAPAEGELDAKAQAVLLGIPPDEAWVVAVSKRLKAMAKGIRNGQ
jgi:hypothetical protein